MIERSLKDAIQQFRKNIDDSDYANLGAKGKYLTVPYRIKFVRDYFGERMSIQTESTELSNGSHKFKANIFIDEKLVSVGESKQMKNADKEFEKQQTVSIGRGLSILGFFGDELATAEEMEQFLKPQKKETPKQNVKPVAKPKVNTKELADQWLTYLKDAAKNAETQPKFEENLNPLREEFKTELQQIASDLIQQQRIDDEYNSLNKQILNKRKK
tara:strand:- start:171 stop:815 length:645 start_codon:yes stop_codon:yes gene_type:complete